MILHITSKVEWEEAQARGGVALVAEEARGRDGDLGDGGPRARRTADRRRSHRRLPARALLSRRGVALAGGA